MGDASLAPVLADSTQSADFLQVQRDFCAWLRQPDQHDLPMGVAPVRMSVYRELLFNNVCSFIDVAYPIACSLLPSALWQSMQQDFFAHGQCSSPLYADISLHFREYIEQVQHPALGDYPWLQELLHVEWMELYVDMADVDWPSHVTDLADPAPSQARQQWQLQVPVWILAYQWPVWRWRVGQSLDDVQPAPSAVLVWRDPQYALRIEPLNPIAAYVIDLLGADQAIDQKTLSTQLQQALPQMSLPQCQDWLNQIEQYLGQRQLLV